MGMVLDACINSTHRPANKGVRSSRHHASGVTFLRRTRREGVNVKIVCFQEFGTTDLSDRQQKCVEAFCCIAVIPHLESHSQQQSLDASLAVSWTRSTDDLSAVINRSCEGVGGITL